MQTIRELDGFEAVFSAVSFSFLELYPLEDSTFWAFLASLLLRLQIS